MALWNAAVAANAAIAHEIPPPTGPGWEPLRMPRVRRETIYDSVRIDGEDVLRARSECAASARIHRMSGVDLARTPWLSWRWRVDEAPDAGDPHEKPGDDFALRVYVLIAFDPARASLVERLRHRLGRTLFGAELPGSALNYVWSRRMPAGSRWDNPFTSASKMISLGAGPTGRFAAVAVNVYADAHAQFGGDPGPIAGVAIMSDTDQSCGHATAFLAGLRFSAEQPPDTDSAGRAAGAAAAPAGPQRDDR